MLFKGTLQWWIPPFFPQWKGSWLVTWDRDLREDFRSSVRLQPWIFSRPAAQQCCWLGVSLSLSYFFFSIPHSECSKGERLKQTPKPERSARGFPFATASANLPSVLTVKPLMPPSSARSSKKLLFASPHMNPATRGCVCSSRRGRGLPSLQAELTFILSPCIHLRAPRRGTPRSLSLRLMLFFSARTFDQARRVREGGGNVSLPLEAPSLWHRRGQGRREWKVSSLRGTCCVTLWVQTERSDNLMSCSAQQHSDGARWLPSFAPQRRSLKKK